MCGCVKLVTRSVKSRFVSQWVGRQAADGLFLRPDNHSRPLSVILGYKLFPSSARVCARRERPMGGGHEYAGV